MESTQTLTPVVSGSAVPASMANGAVRVIAGSAVPESMATGRVAVIGRSAVPESMAATRSRGEVASRRTRRPGRLVTGRPQASH